ncbi:MAG: hypothetical protein J7M21_04040, partial [Planctomycetes bacterium]|nr:hypothetical protein [Planctomycetota bacterium]
RCSLVRFGPLPWEFVRRRLVADGTDAPEAAFWAAFTDGSLGRSLRLARMGLYEMKRRILAAVAATAAGGSAELAEQLARASDQLASQEVAEVRQAAGAELSRTLATRRAAAILLEIIATAYRDALAGAAGIDRPPVHADQAEAVGALARRFTVGQLADILEQLSSYERLIWRNVNPKTVWDNVAITCVSAARLGI